MSYLHQYYNNMIKTIATTRFNDDTYKQNINYKRKIELNIFWV